MKDRKGLLRYAESLNKARARLAGLASILD